MAGFVPSTGVAPIEVALAAPSGSLALAIVAVVAPVAEELFFRGLVYTLLEDRFGKGTALGRNIAFAGSWLVFAAAHLPQQWGAWGAVASVALAGLMFTVVRRITGSALASGAAHLSHNAFINLLAISA